MTQLKDRFMYHPTVEDTVVSFENTEPIGARVTHRLVPSEDEQVSFANVINARTQAGELREARNLARTIWHQSPNHPALMRAIAKAFETSLDFVAAGEVFTRLHWLSEPGSINRLEADERIALMAELDEQAAALHYDRETLLAVPEYYVQSIKDLGRRVHSVDLLGATRCSLSLCFGIDAEVCSPIFYALIAKLVERFPGRTADELVSCDIRSYVGSIVDVATANSRKLQHTQ